MYEEFALENYLPILAVLEQNNVRWVIVRTYANARVLIPKMLEYGFNCLWACEVNTESMDYRDLRSCFGKDLRLIGGIDLDILREDKVAIKRELEKIVPNLVADGGYIPLADGRVRADIPFENYVYYRQLLSDLTEI
jgi:uroporphyrinogen-III decarboxylase